MKKILAGLGLSITAIASTLTCQFALLPAVASAGTLLERSCKLEATDATLTDESLFDPHLFAGTAGQSVTISLTSNDFDPYILLLDETSTTLGENDDVSEDDINSLMTVKLPSDGYFTVLANSYDQAGIGDYTLRVTSPTGTSQPVADLPADCR